jgi:hypothetical protein
LYSADRDHIIDHRVCLPGHNQLVALSGGTGRDKLHFHSIFGKETLLLGHIKWQRIDDRQGCNADLYLPGRLHRLRSAGGQQQNSDEKIDSTNQSG